MGDLQRSQGSVSNEYLIYLSKMIVEVFLKTGCCGSFQSLLKDNLVVGFIFICHQTGFSHSLDLPSHHHKYQSSCHNQNGKRDCDENTNLDVNIRVVAVFE